MRLKDKIRLGEPTRKHIHEPESEQQCLNCGASYHGSYCPHCGQSHEVSRITLGKVITSFLKVRFLAKPKRASSLWSYGLTKSFVTNVI